MRSLRPREQVVRRMIRLLADGGEALEEPTERVAARLDVGRSTLYGSLRRDGLPGVAHWQILFRLLDAAQVMERGASCPDAAFRANLADDRSLRAALQTHFALTVGEIRRHTGWQWLVDRWIERYVDG